MSAGLGVGWGGVSVYLALYSLFYPSFSLMLPWGRVGRPCGGTYEMSAGRSGGGCECLFNLA